MKRIVLFILSLSLLGGTFHIQTVSAEEDYEIPEESIISGDGSADNPYVVDEETEGFLLDMALKENGLVSSSKPGMRKAKGVNGTETLTKILTGKAYKNQKKGGYWIYKSNKPNVKYNGMIWMKQVQYVSYDDAQTIFNSWGTTKMKKLKDHADMIKGLPFSKALDYLRRAGYSLLFTRSVLKYVGAANIILSVAARLSELNDTATKNIFQKTVSSKRGVLRTSFMTSYQGQWYQHSSTEVWTNYPLAKEPGTSYGKGTYKSY